MYIKNLKILVLLSFGFFVVALGMYFDGKNTSRNSSSELLFPSFDDVLPEISYIEFSNQNGKSVIENIDNQWLISSSNNFPANTELLSRFFIQLREANILDAKTNRDDLLYKLGLDDENKMQLLLKSKNNSSQRKIVWRDSNFDLITLKTSNPIFSKAPTGVCQNCMSVFELHSKLRVLKKLNNFSRKFKRLFFSQFFFSFSF